MAIETRAHVHDLVDQLPARQLKALETILLDPVALAVALAPIDDEPVTDEDRLRFQQVQGGRGTSMDGFLTEFGLTMGDFPIRNP